MSIARRVFVGSIVLLAACSSTPASHGASAAGSRPFSINGYYVEACSCLPPCSCELTGPDMTCKGVGAYSFDSGSFDGQDFSGTRVAYSLYIGDSVHLYIDAPNAQKRATAELFAKAALKGFGPVKGVSDAKIELSGHDGTYTVKVDGGKIMTCTTEPVMGGDMKTPVVHSNGHDVLNPTMYQGLCDGCTYSDGDMKITLEKGRNAYFNQHMQASGKL
jgi:hypothetical protein